MFLCPDVINDCCILLCDVHGLCCGQLHSRGFSELNQKEYGGNNNHNNNNYSNNDNQHSNNHNDINHPNAPEAKIVSTSQCLALCPYFQLQHVRQSVCDEPPLGASTIVYMLPEARKMVQVQLEEMRAM